MRGTGRGRELRAGALLVSIGLHVVLIVVLVRYLSQAAHHVEGPVISVSLVPALTRDKAVPQDRVRQKARAERPSASAAPAPRPSGEPPAAPSGSELRPGADEQDKGTRTLRGLSGCDRAAMSREERERCETRRWAGSRPSAGGVNLDPSGRYAENPEPFLSRRPTKGCRVRATGDTHPMGESGNARAGVTCVVPF